MQILRIFPSILLLQLRIDGRCPLNTRFYSILLWIFCISVFFLTPSLVSLIQGAIVPFTPAKADYGEAKFTVGRNVEVFVRHFAPRRPRLGVIQMQIH